MSKEILSLNKPRIPEKEYGDKLRSINHQLIDELAKKGLQDIGVTLDFDESIQGATKKRLADVMHYFQVIRRKNKAIKEHNP